jgi:hypothetical protein
VTAWLVACCVFLLGCTRSSSGIAVSWEIDPTPPVAAAPAVVRLTLRDNQGRPVPDAKLQLEAHMSHPGMAPVVSELTGGSDGTYETRVHLSMPGEWVLVATGRLADGTRMTREHKVAVRTER